LPATTEFAVSDEPVTVPAPLPNGPTVLPLICAYIPTLVVHTSPLTGAVGAEPCGMRRLEMVVLPAGSIKFVDAEAPVPIPMAGSCVLMEGTLLPLVTITPKALAAMNEVAPVPVW
jgi:hypothetical protein